VFQFKGNTSSLAISPQKAVPMLIRDFCLVNKSGATATVNVYLMLEDSSQISILDSPKSLNAGEMYSQSQRQIVMLATDRIKIHSSASMDYVFSLDNVNP
jgi:hypothetical protein